MVSEFYESAESAFAQIPVSLAPSELGLPLDADMATSLCKALLARSSSGFDRVLQDQQVQDVVVGQNPVITKSIQIYTNPAAQNEQNSLH